MTSGLKPAPPGDRAPRSTGGSRPAAAIRQVTASEGAVRFLAWTTDDGLRSETARVALTARGLRANGTIIALGDVPCATSYALLCDTAGRTRRITVRSESPSLERAVVLTRAPGAPWLDGIGRPPPHPDLHRAVDIELSTSVFTIGLIVRRLGLHRPGGSTEPVDLTVAQIWSPDLGVRTVARRLGVTGPGNVVGGGVVTRLITDGPDGPGRITVDDEGFVIDSRPDTGVDVDADLGAADGGRR